ncbi:hypothetical protein RF11_09531 [Thelohanellus kitauei]|uniref:Uncharacterized protein n=1 Tax=Thelohanellus kitauei TaxID=669202 RepID=A0A0C2M832_THEKT|nr:hypothetical protein RF11_09531 [Thelohanellus kitauei]
MNIKIFVDHDNDVDLFANILLTGWRRHCPKDIPSSLMIPDFLYEPSWKVNYMMIKDFIIKFTIEDLTYHSREVSEVRLKSGTVTVLPESQIILTNMNFARFESDALKLYSDGSWQYLNRFPDSARQYVAHSTLTLC